MGVAQAAARCAEGAWLAYVMFWLPNSSCHVQVLKDATLFFSRSMPNLVMVIPAMDYIDETFTKGMLKKKTLNPAIRAAIGLAKKTLNRYYSLTDSSDLYCIAMGKSAHYYSDHHSNFSCSYAPSP